MMSKTIEDGVRIPIKGIPFRMRVFPDPIDQREHVALYLGDLSGAPIVRIHSECLTGDVFGSQRCDCGAQLQAAIDLIIKEGSGILLYLRQEGRGIGLTEKLKSYQLQDEGYDTVEANLMLGHAEDEREYSMVPSMLKALHVERIRLITNNPSKIDACQRFGIEVESRIELPIAWSAENASYLETKAKKMKHIIKLPLRRTRTK